MSVCPNKEDETKRFFFIHIQKTAGTSLREHFLQNFDQSEVYPPREGGRQKVLARYVFGQLLIETPASEQTKYRPFHGHMPYAASQKLSFKNTSVDTDGASRPYRSNAIRIGPEKAPPTRVRRC